MIEAISRSFGISGRQTTQSGRREVENTVKREALTPSIVRSGERDLFELARGIDFRARRRRTRSRGII